MRTAHDAFSRRRYFGSLDGIRALSIVAVLWHHTIPAGLEGSFWRRGFLGVDMFFTLSGFLIVTLMLRERDRTNTISMRGFYLRRTLRIFPLYYGTLALVTLLMFVRPSTPWRDQWLQDLPVYLTYTVNWLGVSTLLEPAWSLAAEEQFYLVWPPLERWLANKIRYILAGLLIVSQLIHFGLIDGLLASAFGWGPDEPEMLRQTTFTPILLGVVLAHTLHDRRAFNAVYRALQGKAVPWILAGIIVALCIVSPSDIRGWPRLAIHLFMVALLASVVIREDHGLATVLRLRPLQRIGMISYGIYLLHPFGMHASGVLRDKLPFSIMGDDFVLTSLFSIVIAELSFRFYESPFLRLKEKLSSPRRVPSAPATA